MPQNLKLQEEQKEEQRREDLEDLLLTFEVDPRVYLRNFYRDLLARRELTGKFKQLPQEGD